MSQLEVDKIIPQSGTTLTIGDSGDTISFADGAVIGIDTDTLYIDSANNRVGIGTSSPDLKLDVSHGTSSEYVATFQNTADNLELKIGTTSGLLNIQGANASTNAAYQIALNAEGGNVGIGTSSPSNTLTVNSGTSNVPAKFISTDADAQIHFEDNSTTDIVGLGATGNNLEYRSDLGVHLFRTGNSAVERMRITNLGNVGIGTSSPDSPFTIESSLNSVANLKSTDAECYIAFADSDATQWYNVRVGSIGNDLSLVSGGAEAMRIDSSGNVLVGTTSATYSYQTKNLVGYDDTSFGVSIASGTKILTLTSQSSNGCFVGTRSNDELKFTTNDTERMRIDSSGNVLVGTTTSSGSFKLEISGSTYINGDTRVKSLYPILDNIYDLGTASFRFNDAYITNGVTVGSDQNEKQQIALLTDAEINVAKRISQGFKTYKWNSAVEEKGDSARTHTGVIAQEVQQAFADEGLDAGNYGMFMSDTWWEKEISVDAVAEELDEEGNVIVEGKDAYTYMDTKEEATEGYTEKTRLGIRYPELLSFVSSAFEQRLTNIETRLTALET